MVGVDDLRVEQERIQLPVRRFQFVPPMPRQEGDGDGGQPIPPDPRARSLLAPSVRGFKIADNMSPVPQDRVFFSFNYFNDVNSTLNDAFDAPIVSASLGLPAIFLFGGSKRTEPPRRIPLEHGDVVVWGGPSRFAYHGVAPLRDGEHATVGRLRLNLTFRKAL